ncbi:hypothetical protein WOLCODRAFT_158456 [Wolfiporia cocos MD-104 SS10]|uniref:Uncharacterized protein n=1 Tax=Wolfiporia cocos (strain MD-104) TaxID=742152 RepID=A0A2H3J9K7_WOLCO|nr:hypothetical protein WOLCODRAFT_158456 [Wolfiporia cocos MD-104 SS10]
MSRLPEGFQRPVPLHEETGWIAGACSDRKFPHRNWSHKNVQQVFESADICIIAFVHHPPAEGDADAVESATWRISWMRTSHIMGLFGITHFLGSKTASLELHPRELAWHIALLPLPPSRQFSMFSESPKWAMVGGAVRIEYKYAINTSRELAALMNQHSHATWWLTDIPNPASVDSPDCVPVQSSAPWGQGSRVPFWVGQRHYE